MLEPLAIRTQRAVVQAIAARKRLFAVAALSLCLGVFATPAVFAQSDETVVATVNGKSITLRDVDESILDRIFPLQRQIYAQRKAALENLIISLLLAEAARQKGFSVEEFKKQLTIGNIEVPASEIEREYSENSSAFGAMSPDEAKERIRLSIESQERIKLYKAAMNQLRTNARIDVQLNEPRLPLINRPGDVAAIGPSDAPVTIVEFADFQCSFCHESEGVIKKVLQIHKQDVRLVFKHLPLDIHERAFQASSAAFCAGQQESFWLYHDALFEAKDLSPETLIAIASRLKFDLPKFEVCLSSEMSRLAVLKDVSEAKRLGVNSTPTFIINGRLVQGAIPFDEFKSIIEQELELATPHSKPRPDTARKE